MFDGNDERTGGAVLSTPGSNMPNGRAASCAKAGALNHTVAPKPISEAIAGM